MIEESRARAVAADWSKATNAGAVPRLLSVFLLAASLSQAAHLTSGFHLSFGHRLIRSHELPLMRPSECKATNNETGLCMFSIDCMQSKGTPLSVCKHNYFVGTCCKLPGFGDYVGPIIYSSSQRGEQQPAVKLAQTEALLSAPPIKAGQHQNQKQQLQDKYVISATSLFPAATSSSQPQATSASTAEKSTDVDSFQVQTSLAPRSSAATLAETTPTTAATTPKAALAAQPQTQLEQQLQLVVEDKKSSYELVSPNKSLAVQQSQSIASSATNLQKPQASNQRQPGSQEFNESGASIEQHRQQQLSPVSQTTPIENDADDDDDDDNKYELLATLNSAHSPQLHQLRPLLAPSLDLDSRHNNVYIVEEHPPHMHHSHLVLSDNHQSSVGPQPASYSHSSSSSSSSVSSPSFLSSLSSASTGSALFSPTTAAMQETSSAISGLLAAAQSASSHSEAQMSIHEDQQQAQQQAASADLVSSELQFTTPFTSSLSTALIPNVSQIAARIASSASPTVAPTSVQFVSTPASQSASTSLAHTLLSSSPSLPLSQSTLSATSPPFSASSQQATTASDTTSAAASSATPTTTTTTTTTANKSSAAAASQLYANLHQQQQIANGSNSNKQLLASTKTVAAGSSTNQLIPGFGSLQSAILSHIPFRIASGLSTGLSNYLAQAMKPQQGGAATSFASAVAAATKPLVSSNNAPALQYQQASGSTNNSTGNTNSNNNTSAKPQLAAVRFPSASTSSTLAPSSSPSSSSSLDSTAAGSSPASSQASTASTSTERDFVEQARLVCGQPQAARSHLASSIRSLESTGNDISSLLLSLGARSSFPAKRRIARIVGGRQSQFGQWPWMVSLRQWRKGAFLHKCGAALLNENWAITAAHCVENVKPSELLLRLGEFDVSSQSEPFPYIEKRVKKVVSHESFDSKTFEYDLALLKFAEPVRFERNVLPVCVPHGNDSYVDRLATVIGWGRLYEDGPLPDVIQHVDVPIITNEECERMYKSAGYIEEIPNMFICAGIQKGGKDSCEGDSGGPLTMIDNDGRAYLVGIISWGIGCALPSQPGVYTRITAFSSWINSIALTA